MTTAALTWLNDDTVQLRQPKTSHWEAPFLFLLFGSERALLLDTGATTDEAVFPLRATIDALMEEWLDRHPLIRGSNYGLVVAHTHSHGDHIAGDALLLDRPATVLVGTTTTEVIEFFGFEAWPTAVSTFDLGGRILDLIGAPGHEPSALVFFDRAAGILFTGDSVAPCRLYVRDRPAFMATIDRLIRFRDASPTAVRALLGAHVEMSNKPGVDYPAGTIDQPDEAPLALDPGVLDEVRGTLAEAGDDPKIVVRDRFILWNLI
ncbi:MBL fold metallo-hydrolase [Paenarthrobacter sp. Z7-10]|uniref:MBL fold metallo-hydrolase n=1 Tax=Paenarthrobacter sp. Z7-10 TaxID=2787635 RepID=UPI0022A96BBE|nr:MBL fold metallo-hydrolase [Paenarthrobacter sp. Z7-10]MCZ2403902.1 MBL fold metallo-hydrolase [Paenarthrobacter sp. Z7-10]